MIQLLVVEDSLRLQELLNDVLRDVGYHVSRATTVAELHCSTREAAYDILIIDLMLPDGDGLDAIRALRADGCSAPILVITARGSIEDRVSALDAGADDFLLKPFNHGELLARIRALLRRPSKTKPSILRLGRTQLDEAKVEVLCSGKPIDLRLAEHRLFALLMRRAGGVVTKETIARAFERRGREITVNAVEAQVSRLRKALERADSGVLIETVPGIGYRLCQDRQ